MLYLSASPMQTAGMITHPNWNQAAPEKLVLTGFSVVSGSTLIKQRKKVGNQNLVTQKFMYFFYMMLNEKGSTSRINTDSNFVKQTHVFQFSLFSR